MSSVRPALYLTMLLLSPLSHAEEPASTEPASDSTASSSAEAKAKAAPVVERATLSERSSDEAQALARSLPAEQQHRLNADDQEFLTLWKPANRPEALGVAIVIPGAGESSNWPKTIAPLREKLPDSGWSTLSLTLPDPPSQVLTHPAASEPQAEANTETNSPEQPPSAAASESDKAPEPAQASSETEEVATPADANATPEPATKEEPAPIEYGALIKARLQAALAFAQEQKAPRIVLIGHGLSAYWASEFVQTLDSSAQPAVDLILIAAQEPEHNATPLAELLPKLKVAIADFYYKDRSSDRQQALLRKQAEQRNKEARFTQVALKAQPGNLAIEQEQLYRRVRGWLEKTSQPPTPTEPTL